MISYIKHRLKTQDDKSDFVVYLNTVKNSEIKWRTVLEEKNNNTMWKEGKVKICDNSK